MFDGQYLTKTEYTTLGGSLTENAFNLLEYEARKKIDKYTQGRLIELTTQLKETKLCVFKLIDVLNENKTSIQSEGVDGYSITRMEKKELEKLIRTIITDNLSECKLEDGTPYLYLGVD
jgi:Glu-tRNA(Gln) amidotransferase subunit E-like FAD-binding protein